MSRDEMDSEAVGRRWRLWAGLGLVAVVIAAVLSVLLLRPAAVEESPSDGPPAATAGAAPVPPSNWGPELMATLDEARSDFGGVLAGRVCVSCHGVDGASSTQDLPSLAGQSAAAIYKPLLDFQTGARRNPFMTPIAQSLVAGDLANLAVFYGRHANPTVSLAGGRSRSISASDVSSRRAIPAAASPPATDVTSTAGTARLKRRC